MLGALKRKAASIRAINQDSLLSEVIETDIMQSQIIDLNQKQLYEQGVQADGSETGQYASITITYYKPLAGLDGRDSRSDHITGKDTGETYDSMTVKSLPEGIVISAVDRNNFFDRIDKGLGLTKQSISEILPEIKERLREQIKKHIA